MVIDLAFPVLESDIKSMKTDIVDLKTGQQRLEHRMETVDEGQQRLVQRMETVEKGQQRLELRMENEVIQKISALSDGYIMRGDQIEKLQKHMDERFDKIENSTGYLVSRVALLEKAARL